MRWKAKVSMSLTDVRQQLFELQDITVICTIHFHPWLHENHTIAPAPGDTNWNRHAGTCLSEASEGRQWDDWNVVSNQQSFIDQAIDQWQDCFNACLKAASKHWTFAIMFLCNSHDFLKRTLLLLWTNWLMFCFTRRVRTSVRIGGQFCCSFVANLLQYLCAKNYGNIRWFNKVIAKIKRVQFFCPTV